MSRGMSSRRIVRERVMQALYAFKLAGGDPQHFINTILKPDLADNDANLEFATTNLGFHAWKPYCFPHKTLMFL